MTTTIHEDPTTAAPTTEVRVQAPSTVPNHHVVGSVPGWNAQSAAWRSVPGFREAFFKGKLHVPEPVPIDLDYDVRTAPTISFAAASAEVDDAIRERVQQAMAEARLEGSVEEAVRALAGPVTFTGEMAEVILGYQFKGQPRREVKIGVAMSGVPEIVMQGTRRVIRPKLVTIRAKGPDPETSLAGHDEPPRPHPPRAVRPSTRGPRRPQQQGQTTSGHRIAIRCHGSAAGRLSGHSVV
jgi:hypothetical protein